MREYFHTILLSDKTDFICKLFIINTILSPESNQHHIFILKNKIDYSSMILTSN